MDKGAPASQTGPSQVEPVPVSPLRASVPSAALGTLEVFRAVMIANGDRDPGAACKGMFENCPPADREYVEALATALAGFREGAA